tara:strand:+ start:106 stop:384 length:279 start_codon:yes stop_codon:yes gene_type:complete
MTSNHRCIRAIVSGRVQGVCYRYSTQEQALARNISGYAKNLSNGDVEVIACGNQDEIGELIQWLRQGPTHAQVASVQIEEIDPPTHTGFHTC